MTTTPRTASFDDLRVGQWVAWTPESGASCGKIIGRRGDREVFAVAHGADSDEWPLTRTMTERGEVTILRDAPAPPVTVRREDYDALAEALDDFGHHASARAHQAARALIDHADLGDTA